MQEVREQFAGEHQELLDAARRVVAALAEARRCVLADAADEVLDLAIMLAERIVTKVAGDNIGAAKGNMVKALELVGLGGQVVVKVNPAQLQALVEFFGDTSGMSGAGDVKIVPDEQISRGGVKVESAHGRIDATIETQLDNVVRALLGDRGDRLRRSGQTAGGYESAALAAGETARQPKLMIQTHGSA